MKITTPVAAVIWWGGVFLVLGAIIYGGWRFERWWNYKMSTQGHVQKEIQPLIVRIDALEKRVLELEKAK